MPQRGRSSSGTCLWAVLPSPTFLHLCRALCQIQLELPVSAALGPDSQLTQNPEGWKAPAGPSGWSLMSWVVSSSGGEEWEIPWAQEEGGWFSGVAAF